MSLLNVTVKKARYVGMQSAQLNTYVTLKLQNVKSTTVTVKGPTPSWEQDFLFETNDMSTGLLVEVWNKGVIWDRALGYHWMPLTSVSYSSENGVGRWIELEAQLMVQDDAVVGTSGVTGHSLLLDCRFELPFDAEGAGADLQRKLDLLNGALHAERAEQARRQMQYFNHTGYSEDSDYTSDLNYPVGQHANCSASQFRSAAHVHTPQRSLEVSRENSYEYEESFQRQRAAHERDDAEPMYYNSRPRQNNRSDNWSNFPSHVQPQVSVESSAAASWRTAGDWRGPGRSGESLRRPSLERQDTLYDDGLGYETHYTNTFLGDNAQVSHQTSYEDYYEASSYPHQSDIYNHRSEDRIWDSGGQWESGGSWGAGEGRGLWESGEREDGDPNVDDFFMLGSKHSIEYENMINKRRSSVVQIQLPKLPVTISGRSEMSGMAPYRPSRRRGAASLPVTPSSTPFGRALPIPPAAGPMRGSRARRLPQPPVPRARPPVRPPARPSATSHLLQQTDLYTPASKLPGNRRDVQPATSSAVTWSKSDSVSGQRFNNRSCSYEDQSYDYTEPDNINSGFQYDDQSFDRYQDEEDTHPFFDETPHPTPPAIQKPWTQPEPIHTQFDYPPPQTTQAIQLQTPSVTQTQNRDATQAPHWLPGHVAQDTQPPEPPRAVGMPQAAVMAAAGAQSLGRFMAGGAQKLGSFFSNAAAAPRAGPGAVPAARPHAAVAQTAVPTPAPVSFLRQDSSVPKPALQRTQSVVSHVTDYGYSDEHFDKPYSDSVDNKNGSYNSEPKNNYKPTFDSVQLNYGGSAVDVREYNYNSDNLVENGQNHLEESSLAYHDQTIDSDRPYLTKQTSVLDTSEVNEDYQLNALECDNDSLDRSDVFTTNSQIEPYRPSQDIHGVMRKSSIERHNGSRKPSVEMHNGSRKQSIEPSRKGSEDAFSKASPLTPRGSASAYVTSPPTSPYVTSPPAPRSTHTSAYVTSPPAPTSRKTSTNSYDLPLTRQGTIDDEHLERTDSVIEELPDEDEHSQPGLEVPGQARVSLESEPRVTFTPKQRWHRAYNKVIMQLNKLRFHIGLIG